MRASHNVPARSIIGLLLGAWLVMSPVVAAAKSILIYGPLLHTPDTSRPDNEQTLAVAAGHTVTVKSDSEWGPLTIDQFRAFDAIVLPDAFVSPNCLATPPNSDTNPGLFASRAAWSSAANGGVIVFGTDPIFHQTQTGKQAKALITNAINFAASGPGTGLYVSLGCYYFNTPPPGPQGSALQVDLLAALGEFGIEGVSLGAGGIGSANADMPQIVAPTHPAMVGLTDDGLSGWGESIHELFDYYPSSFTVLAKYLNSTQPYILARSPQNQPPFFDLIADQFVNPPLNVDRTLAVTGAVPGPAPEVAAGQTVTFVAASDNTALIPNPTISGSGTTRTLTYRRASTGTGTATITVTAQDNLGVFFSRPFEITVGAGAEGAVSARVTTVNLTGGPLVTVNITAAPIDFDGLGVPGCYRFFPPRPAPSEAFNVIPSNADQTPEAPPWRIPEDTVEICNQAQTFTGVVDLSQWKTTLGPQQIDFTYVSLVKDVRLELPGGCPVPNTCEPRIWTGIKPAGSITIATGNTVAVKNTVTLKTLDIVTKAATSIRLSAIPVRDFDLRNHDFLVAAAGAVKSTIGSSPPTVNFTLLSTILGKLFEADKGRVGTCVTDSTGVCFAGQDAPAFDLVVVKFVDADTGRTVYVGDVKRPADFVNGTAVENIVIVKLVKNGVFQGYLPGLLTFVN